MSNYDSLDNILMQGKPLGSVERSGPQEEFYEVFPWNESQALCNTTCALRPLVHKFMKLHIAGWGRTQH